MSISGKVLAPCMEELAKLSSETNFLDYAVHVVDRRGYYLKQNIIEDLQVVNSRINRNYKEWEQREEDTGPSVPTTKTEELMEQQQKFIITKHNLLKEKETKTTYIYEMIKRIKNVKTRDPLLDFLHDYKEQCRYLDCSSLSNEEVLKEISDYILHERGRLITIDTPNIENVIDEGAILRDSYMATMSRMRRMRYLRDCLVPFKKYVVSNKPTISTMIASDTSTGEPKPPDPMVESLKTAMIASGQDFDDAVEFLDDITRRRRTLEAEIKGMKASMMKQEVELKKLRLNKENVANDQTTLQNKVERLRTQIIELILENKKKRAKMSPFKDRSTQTTTDIIFSHMSSPRTSIESNSSETAPHRSSEPSDRKSSEAVRFQAMDVIESESSGVSPASQPLINRDFPRLPSTMAQEQAILDSMQDQEGSSTDFQGADMQGRAFQDSGRKHGGDAWAAKTLRERTHSRREGRPKMLPPGKVNVSRSYTQFKKIFDTKMAQVNPELEDSTSSLHADERRAMEVPSLQFRALLLRTVTTSMGALKFFVRKVLNERNNAREEIKIKDELSKQIKRAEGRVRELLRTRDGRQSKVHNNDTVEVVKHRKSGEHVCVFCLCHDPNEQAQSFATMKSEEEVEDMAVHCCRYIATLGTVEEPFAQVCGKLINVDELVSSMRSDYMVDERDHHLKTTSRHYDLDVDDESIKKKADIFCSTPHGTKDLMDQTELASATLESFVKEAKVMFMESKKRNTDICDRNTRLRSLMELIPKLEAVHDRAGLDLRALCAGGKALPVEEVIRGSVCPYCNCPSLGATSTPHREMMPLSRITAKNAMITQVMAVKHCMERLVSSVKTNVLAQAPSRQAARRSSILDEAMDPLVLSLVKLVSRAIVTLQEGTPSEPTVLSVSHFVNPFSARDQPLTMSVIRAATAKKTQVDADETIELNRPRTKILRRGSIT